MSLLATLVAQRLRRDRWQLPCWILGTGALALMTTGVVADTYGTEADRAEVLRLIAQTPVILIFRGTPNGPGIGPFSFFLIFAFLALLAGLMNTFLAVRHTRGDEEQDRSDLVAATPAGRVRPTVATLVHGVLADLVLAIVVALAFTAGGLPVGGAVVAGAATGVVGLVFLGLGLLAAQLFRTSRAANGLGVTLVLLAYLVRGIGDATGTSDDGGIHVTAGWASLLSPIGWGQRVEAWGANGMLPLLPPLGLAAGCVVAVLALQRVRDLGASILPGPRGRANAGPLLAGVAGLAWNLNAGSVLGWAVGGFATGLLATSLSPLIGSIGDQAPEVADAIEQLGGGGGLDQAMTATFFAIVGILAAAAAVQIVGRARQEETNGTAELVLATPVPRVRWLAAFALAGALGALGTVTAALLGGLLGAAGLAEPGDPIRNAAISAAGQFPAALVFLAVALLLFVFASRVAIGIGWALLGAGAFLGVFGELLGLPGWSRDLSPFALATTPAGEAADWAPTWLLAAVALAGIAIALAAMRRRALVSGG